MNDGGETDALRDLLRQADSEVQVPADLWQRLKAPRPRAGRGPLRWRPSRGVTVVLLVLVGAAFGAGLVLLARAARRR